MAGKDKQAPETIRVRIVNAHRTSAGDYSPPGIVTLPADEARDLMRQGLAVRLP